MYTGLTHCIHFIHSIYHYLTLTYNIPKAIEQYMYYFSIFLSTSLEQSTRVWYSTWSVYIKWVNSYSVQCSNAKIQNGDQRTAILDLTAFALIWKESLSWKSMSDISLIIIQQSKCGIVSVYTGHTHCMRFTCHFTIIWPLTSNISKPTGQFCFSTFLSSSLEQTTLVWYITWSVYTK